MLAQTDKIKPCEPCRKKFHIRMLFHLYELLMWLDEMMTRTNWKATFYQSRLQKRYVWIGKGFNPDYTTACTPAGSGTCVTGTCVAPDGGDCVPNDAGCSCSCPTPPPIANSHYVSNTCVKGHTGCTCYYQGGAFRCRTLVCSCSGACSYSCDIGYTWNGSTCVVAGGPTGVKTMKDTAIASVKTVNDTVVGSVKTLNG